MLSAKYSPALGLLSSSLQAVLAVTVALSLVASSDQGNLPWIGLSRTTNPQFRSEIDLFQPFLQTSMKFCYGLG